MTPEIQEVVRDLDGHRAKFEAFCRSLSEEELDREVPNSHWLVRDFIAHLATIDGPVRVMFESMTGEQPAGTSTPDTSSGERWDVDRWNDSRVAARRTKTVDEIFAEAAQERARMHEALARLSEADLDKTMHFGGDNKRAAADIRLGDYIRGWAKHDVIHVADMLRALPERDTPEVQAWLDDPAVTGYQRMMNR
jgi:hypothetical protein